MKNLNTIKSFINDNKKGGKNMNAKLKKVFTILVFIFMIGMGYTSVTSKLINEEIQTAVSSIDDDIDWWPMFHHDLNCSGYSTSTGPDTNNILWAFHVEDGIDISSPAIVDNKVYFGDIKGNFFCLDSYTGAEVWNRTVPYTIRDSSPAVENGKVYFAGYYHTVEICIYCLNSTNGEIIWRYKIPGGDLISASPVVYDGRVFIGAPDPDPGRMYCLDADTGEEIWVSQTIDNPGSAAIYSDRVFFGAEDFNIYCFNADNGSVIWKYKTGGEETPYIHVAIYNDKLYAGGRDGLYCLDLEDGSLVWKYPTDDYIYTTPCIAYGFVYFAPVDDKIYCLDAVSGEKIWEYDIPLYVFSSPAVADGKVYVGTFDCFLDEFRDLGSGMIYCLDADTGEKIWEYDTASRVFCTPAVANGKVYVGTFDLYTSSNEMYCFSGESDNNPPLTPNEILGPKFYRPYVTYTYNTSTFDPDGDQLYYKWWWGEGGTGWLGPYGSNETVEINITFVCDYPETIKVIVQDSYYARSDWARLEVRVTRDKTILNSFFLRLLERYPLLKDVINFIQNKIIKN
jgi:outer membrane protein assembly factor BamB